MAFAVMGVGYNSDLLIIDGPIDGDRYIQDLKTMGFIEELDQKYGPMGWIFQQDGAPAHTGKSSLEWLEDRLDGILDWRVNSPNLSPIKL